MNVLNLKTGFTFKDEDAYDIVIDIIQTVKGNTVC